MDRPASWLGIPDAVRQRVRELRALFPTGLVISPSHEAILPDTPPANIQALFEAASEQLSKWYATDHQP